MSVIESLMKDFVEGNAMLSGVDSGNTSTKVSVLNREGNIETHQFPTVIAPAPSNLGELTEHQSNQNMEGIQKLHVKISSDAISNKTPKYYYVGEYAKDKKNKEQPTVDDPKKANKKLHIVTTLTALAIAAWETGKEGDVVAPFSGGLPIGEIQAEFGEKYLKDFLGTHTVEAIDGPYKGKKVNLIIKDGTVNVEGVTSELGLRYNIKKSEIEELTIGNRIGEKFAVVDGGAGTLDIGLFDELGFNAELSEDHDIGTNPHIDGLMETIEKEVFEEYYKKVQESRDYYISKQLEVPRPYRTREQFMREVIHPGVESMVENKKDKNFKPVFKAKWGREEADVTDLVLSTMSAYAKEVLTQVDRFELSTNIDSFIIVGGGLLFGLYEYRKLDSKFYIFPEEIENASAITSSAYLVRNYLNKLAEYTEKEEEKTASV